MRVCRRTFLKSAGVLALASSSCVHVPSVSKRLLVNDVQSRLNATYVDGVIKVRTLEQLRSTVGHAADSGRPVGLCGGRHSMGGQQFLAEHVLLDTTGLRRVLNLDTDKGLVEVEAGIQWPGLLKELLTRQRDAEHVWTFAQKQTGANRFCLGGALASNIHSRGLRMKPFISDVESFTLVDHTGTLRKCSRTENRELFQLAIGGYGLFGVVYSITLRLVPRRKLQRVVELLNVDELIPA